jgi:hypothetical protein
MAKLGNRPLKNIPASMDNSQAIISEINILSIMTVILTKYRDDFLKGILYKR